MPIIRQNLLTREEIRANRHILYVFGDNLQRRGGEPDSKGRSNPRAGQAAACRGEPNAVGIPTKRAPSMAEDAFFTDDDFDQVQPIIAEAFRRLAEHVLAGGTVVIPGAGVGTERAQLARRAPRLRTYIDNAFAQLAYIAARS